MADDNDPHIEIIQGATFRLDIVYTDEAGVKPNLGIGYTARFMLRKTLETADPPDVSLTQASGITLGANGAYGAKIEAAATADLDPGDYVYAADITHTATGEVIALVEATASVKRRAIH